MIEKGTLVKYKKGKLNLTGVVTGWQNLGTTNEIGTYIVLEVTWFTGKGQPSFFYKPRPHEVEILL